MGLHRFGSKPRPARGVASCRRGACAIAYSGHDERVGAVDALVLLSGCRGWCGAGCTAPLCRAMKPRSGVRFAGRRQAGSPDRSLREVVQRDWGVASRIAFTGPLQIRPRLPRWEPTRRVDAAWLYSPMLAFRQDRDTTLVLDVAPENIRVVAVVPNHHCGFGGGTWQCQKSPGKSSGVNRRDGNGCINRSISSSVRAQATSWASSIRM